MNHLVWSPVLAWSWRKDKVVLAAACGHLGHSRVSGQRSMEIAQPWKRRAYSPLLPQSNNPGKVALAGYRIMQKQVQADKSVWIHTVDFPDQVFSLLSIGALCSGLCHSSQAHA